MSPSEPAGERRRGPPGGYPMSMKLEILDLREKEGLSYRELAARYGLSHHKRNGQNLIGRFIWEARRYRGQGDQKPHQEYGIAGLAGPNDPKEEALVSAYLISQGLETPYKLSAKNQSAYKAMYYSILRECRELQQLPQGSVVETAWDYSNPTVKGYATRHGVFPSHLTTIHGEGDQETADDYHYLQER